MIEIITGIVGFAAGISVAAAYFRKKKRTYWGTGYVKVREEMFPKRNDTSSTPLYPELKVPEQTQTTEQQKDQDQEGPKMPSW